MNSLERLKRTLNFQETDEVVTGEIIQNGSLINHFSKREVRNDWTMEEIAATYRALEIDVGMLIAPAGMPHTENRYGLTYEVTFWSEWVVERPFDDVRGAQEFLKKLITTT